MSNHSAEQSTTHHVVPLGTYVAIFVALMVLTGITVGVAFLDLGFWNTPIALTIAVGKATLVVLFFMHLRWSRRLTQVWALAGLLWLILLIAGTADDFLTRGWLPIHTGWQ